MNPYFDDQVGSTPNQIRLIMVGYCVPGALGLTGGGMAIFLRLDLVATQYTTLGGFIPALLYAFVGQILFRRAIQKKEPSVRVGLIARLRTMLTVSTILAISGLLLSLVLLYALVPANGSEDFFVGRILSTVFSIIGVGMTPFAFAARRIPWVAHPA